MVVAQVVAHRTMRREVLGSNPAAVGSWAFFSLSRLFPIFQSVVCPKSGPSWRSNTTGIQLSKKHEKLSGAA